MDKLKYIKIEDEDGSLSNNIPIGVDAENVDISSNNFKNLLDYINENDNQIDNLKNSNISLSNQIKSLSSGSPKGSYATVDELIRVNPETGVYIITENGHIYSWTKDAESAIDLGVYQSTGISDNSIYKSMLNDDILKSFNLINLYNYMTVKTGGVEDSGYFNPNISDLKTSDYIKVIPGERYVILQIEGNVLIRFSNYNSNKEFINMSVYQNNRIITIPENVNYINIGVLEQNYLKFIFMKYEEYLKIFKNEYINPFFKIPYENLPLKELSESTINFKNLNKPIKNVLNASYYNNGQSEKIIDTITSSYSLSTGNNIFISVTPIQQNYFIENIKLKPTGSENINCKIILFTKDDTNFNVKKIINAPFILNETDEKIFDINYFCEEPIYIGILHPYYHIKEGTHSSWSIGKYTEGKLSYTIPDSIGGAVIEMEVDTINCNIVKNELDKYYITPDMDLTTIINSANDNDIFILFPGEYNSMLNTDKNISIIGLDKEKTIIYNDTGDYHTQPAYLRNGNYKNITFYAKNNENNTPTSLSYAVHIDNVKPNTKIIFEDCNFISDWNSALGVGLATNSYFNFIRCNFIYKGNRDNSNKTPLFLHSAEPTISRGDNQNCYFEDCNFINETEQASLHIMDRQYKNENSYLTFKKCCCYSKINRTTNQIQRSPSNASGDGWLNFNTIFLNLDSFGNNIEELNT